MSNKTSSISHKLFALFVVIFGVLLLLNNIGVLDLGPLTIWALFWSAVCIFYGAKIVFASIRSSDLSWFWGISLLLLGIILLLGHFEVITFELGMIWRLWPLLVVYVGLTTLFPNKSRRHDNQWHHHWDEHGQEEQEFRTGPFHVQVGKIKRRHANWSAEPTELRNAIGEYDFDYTKAFIPEEEIPVKLSGWIGDIKILVPRDVEFAAKARALVGDIYIAGQNKDGISLALTYKTPGYDEAVRKLTFDIDYRILDLRIDYV